MDAFRFINDVITQKGGEGGSQKVTNDDEGGEGVSIPPKNDDVIYEQPLSVKTFFLKYFFKPVDHGVVWLTVSIQGNLIITSSTGFFPHELTNTLRAQVGQARKGVWSPNFGQ